MQGKSAIEQELFRKYSNLVSRSQRHDRGVVFGFVLVLFPIFPVPLFGLAITYFNYHLWKKGKLYIDELSLIRKSFYLGVLNSLAGLLTLYWLVNFLGEVQWHELLNWLSGYWQRVIGIFESSKNASNIGNAV